jgi:hypothetical protein
MLFPDLLMYGCCYCCCCCCCCRTCCRHLQVHRLHGEQS